MYANPGECGLSSSFSLTSLTFPGTACFVATRSFRRFASGTFESSYNPTVDVDFSQTNVMVGEQRRRVALWQVSGAPEEDS